MAAKSPAKPSGAPLSHEEAGVTTGALTTQIANIVANLNKKNLKSTLNELNALYASHDPSLVETMIVRQLVSQIEWKNAKLPRDQAKIQLLAQKLSQVLALPNYATILCTALDDSPLANESLFSHLMGTLKVSQATAVTVALACSLSLSQALKTLGIKFLHTTLPSLVSDGTLTMDKLSDTLAHDLVAFINDDGSFPSKATVLKAFENVYGSVPIIEPLFSSSTSGSTSTPSSSLAEARKAIRIAGLLGDSGPACTSKESDLRKVLDKAPEPTPQAYAEVVTLVVHSQAHYARKGTPWDLRVLAAGLREKSPSMNWDEVVGALDQAKCSVVDVDALRVLIDFHQLASKNAAFPVEELLKSWKNTSVQCTLLCTALSAAYDALTFPPTEELVAAAEGLSVPLNASNSNFIQPYYCLPLVNALLRLSADNASQYSAVWALLQAGPVTHCPAVLLVALAMARPACALRDRLGLALLSLILPVNSQHQSADIVSRLWKLDKELVLNAFVSIYEAEPATLSRILDVTLEVQELKAVLDWKPQIMFAVDLACLASLRDALDLSRWLDDALQKFGSQFADLLISFARDRLERQRAQSPRAREGRPTHTVVSPEAFQTIFDRLRNAANVLTPPQQEELNKLVSAAGETGGFPADVEDEANKNFQLIYSGSLTVEDAIAMLSKYKAATQSSRELKVFQCMIRNLFDEYRFFPKYPDPELKLTGILFGSLVQHHLISYIPLGIALRYVLDALKSPPNAKLFKFGIYALEQFTSRLAEWPQYCLHLKQVPALRQFHPQLAQVIDASAGSGGPISSSPSSGGHAFPQHMETNIYHGSPPTATPVQEQSLPAPPVSTVAATLPVTLQKEREPEDTISSHALNIGTLTDDAERIVKPSEDVQDTIHFIFNNVSPQNLEQKVSELAKVVQPQFFDYLAQYVVTKRASLEENFQELYVEFLERLNWKDFNKKLLAQACRSIRALIASEKIRTETSERSLLKNLANFVGLLTIAKDRPLLHILLPLKNMIVDAYETGKLIAVVPCVSKIIGKAAKTRWFRLPNPWTMGIVRALVEVYNLPNVKLPLKFEIEILSGLLEFSVSEIQPSELLRNRRAYGGPGPINDFEGGPPSFESAEDRAAANASKYQLQYVHLNPSLPMFNQQPALKKAVYVAINRAIHDILVPVVERSVVIGSVTTKELVLKDYAMEPDEAKLLRAAFGMAQSLAGNLAAVTCKESLRGTMVANLRTALSPPVVPGKPAPPSAHLDHAIQVIVQDNLELACAVVQRAAADASIRPSEEHLAAAVQERKRHKERANGKESFYDMNFVGSPAYAFAATLPEFLRPKMGGVTAQQMQVYDEFVSSAQAGYPGATPSPPTSRLTSTGGYGDKDVLRRSTGDLPFEQALKVVDQYILDLLSAATLVPSSIRSFSELPSEHTLHTNVSHAADLLNIAPQQRTEIALHATQRAFVKLFDERTTPIAREVLMAVLDHLSSASVKVKQHLTELLLYAPEPQRFHREVVPILLHSKLVSVADFDVTLAKAISTYHRDAIEFGAYLVQNMVFKAQVLAKADLIHSLEQLIKIGAVSSDIVSAMSDLPPIDPAERPEFDVTSIKSQPAPLEQKLNALVDEWLKICLSGTNEKAQAAFAHKLQQGGYYGGKEAPLTNELAFYAMCLEAAVKKCGASSSLDYTALGHIAHLFVILIKYYPEKPLLLARLLCVTEAVITANHQAAGVNFDQRPFHRLYTSLLGDLATPDPVLEPHAFSLVVEIAHSLHAIRPTSLPGFSFAWMELMASRLLMPKLLKEPVLWVYMEALVVDLLSFLQEVTKDPSAIADSSTPYGSLYRGTLRIMLVLLHDFPEFLCEYHFSLCDVMPTNCVQLRNLVLSAFPRAMKLPDPFTPNLKVDLLPEIKEPPHIRSSYVDVLEKLDDGYELQSRLDNVLRNADLPKPFLDELVSHLRTTTAPAGQRYKRQLINALVLYIGARALSESPNEVNPQAPMEIMRYLATEFDTEGRYVLFNAIANQLRYPNNHTHYFSCVLLFLFAEATQEIVQEQITRVLVERLIVHRPHPWGLLITFIELIKNPRYSFWNRNFTHIAPEIERLFFQVGSSIASHKSGGEA